MKEDTFIEQLIDWSAFDASSQISKRTGGVTLDIVEQEVKLWELQLKLLEPMNYDKVFKEIDAWDISVPPRHALTQENIASTYTKLVSYKVRISKLWADAKAWRDTCETAIKFIEELSMGAFTGAVADKKSNAAHVIQPFVHLKVQTLRLENFLEKIHSSIIFSATQLDLLLKERQSRAKLNFKLGLEGDADSSKIEDEQNDDGDSWNIVRKKF